MKTKILTFLILVSYFSCSKTESELSSNDKIEIEKLESDKHKGLYLINLWHQDQSLRGGQDGEIISKYGYKSEEHKEWNEQFRANDNEVFQKMEYYLKKHGYPGNPSEFEELALNSIPIIIGHKYNYKAQEKLLPYLFNAYKQGNCPLDDVVWLLGEMHESKNYGKRFKMKSNRFTTEDEFHELTKELKLNLKK